MKPGNWKDRPVFRVFITVLMFLYYSFAMAATVGLCYGLWWFLTVGAGIPPLVAVLIIPTLLALIAAIASS